jgi:hypothetical protein
MPKRLTPCAHAPAPGVPVRGWRQHRQLLVQPRLRGPGLRLMGAGVPCTRTQASHRTRFFFLHDLFDFVFLATPNLT